MRMVDGEPELGRGKNQLGVLVGSDEHDDLVEEGGQVRPHTGGMSVSPSLETLPLFRIPRRLRDKYPERFPDATGSNNLHCWRLGEGEFLAGAIAADLVLRPDPEQPEKHGFIEPERKMTVKEYEDAIAATRPSWKIWEE
jgi:hypothetical protein